LAKQERFKEKKRGAFIDEKKKSGQFATRCGYLGNRLVKTRGGLAGGRKQGGQKIRPGDHHGRKDRLPLGGGKKEIMRKSDYYGRTHRAGHSRRRRVKGGSAGPIKKKKSPGLRPRGKNLRTRRRGEGGYNPRKKEGPGAIGGLSDAVSVERLKYRLKRIEHTLTLKREARDRTKNRSWQTGGARRTSDRGGGSLGHRGTEASRPDRVARGDFVSERKGGT